jgi:hypothetical protein
VFRKLLNTLLNCSHWDPSLDKQGIGVCSVKKTPVLLRTSKIKNQRKLIALLKQKGIKHEKLIGGYISCSVDQNLLLSWKKARWISALLGGCTPNHIYNSKRTVRNIGPEEGCNEQETAITLDQVRKRVRKGVSLKHNGNNAITYVLDTGIHDSIRIHKKVSFIGGYGSPSQTSHGTLVASCIKSVSATSIVSVKVLGNDGKGGTLISVLQGLNYCSKQQPQDKKGLAKIINMSLGSPCCATGCCPLCAAAKELSTNGYILVCSAGNSGIQLSCPGSSRYVLSVGAVSGNNLPTRFSSRGKTTLGRVVPDVSSYGVIKFKDKVRSGTSFAAPIVTGALSCCIPKRKIEGRDITKIVRLIISKATPVRGEHGSSRLLNLKESIKGNRFQLFRFKNYKLDKQFRLLRPIMATAATISLAICGWWYGFDKLGSVEDQITKTTRPVVLFGRVRTNSAGHLCLDDGTAEFPLRWKGHSGTKPVIGSCSIIWGELNGKYISGQRRWTVPWL